MQNPIIAKILALRGITAADLEDFLHPTLDKLAKPEELPGIDKAADIILDSVLYRRKIVVFGDYDCDGVCATAIVSRTLRALGGNVSEFIPDRLTEGYGMSESSIARMLKSNPGVGLVITVDNGITAADVVRQLHVSRRLADLRFREITGTSILAYITDIRLEKVKRLLTDTDLRVEEIARHCGYTAGNLKNLFARHFHCSMRAFRRGEA